MNVILIETVFPKELNVTKQYICGPFLNVEDAKAMIESWAVDPSQALAKDYYGYISYDINVYNVNEIAAGTYVIKGISWGPAVECKVW